MNPRNPIQECEMVPASGLEQNYVPRLNISPELTYFKDQLHLFQESLKYRSFLKI